MSKAEMRTYWDDRAREDAFFFVDNRLEYRNPDEAAFWSDGEQLLDYVLKLFDVHIQPTDVVVDIGCGVGRFSRALAGRARHVFALDISEEMLARAKERNPALGNVDWVLGDGESLAGIGEAAADVCFSQVVFQHIPDPAITLRYVEDIGRVLKPSGWALIQVSNDPSIHRNTTPLHLRLLALVGRAPRGQGHPAWLGSAVDLDELREAAARSELDLARVEHAGSQYCEVLLRKPAGAGSPGA